MAWNSWRQAFDAAGHVVSALREQRTVNSRLAFSFYLVQDPSLEDGAAWSGCVFLPLLTYTS